MRRRLGTGPRHAGAATPRCAAHLDHHHVLHQHLILLPHLHQLQGGGQGAARRQACGAGRRLAPSAAASGGAVHAVQALCLRAAGPAGTQSAGQADAARGAARRGGGQRGRRTSSSPSSSSTPLMLGSGLLSSMEVRPMAWAPATMPAACAACCCTCGEAGARQRGEGRGIQFRPGRKRSCGRHGTIFRGGGRRIAWRRT